jgi:hypothetical protein
MAQYKRKGTSALDGIAKFIVFTKIHDGRVTSSERKMK